MKKNPKDPKTFEHKKKKTNTMMLKAEWKK